MAIKKPSKKSTIVTNGGGYKICLRMTANVSAAEDFTQEVFLQIFRKMGTFRGESALNTWIHRLTVNIVLMEFRRKIPYMVSLEDRLDDEAAGLTQSKCGTRDVRLGAAVDRASLAWAIRQLPEGCRRMFVLHEIHGYAHHEIAELLGCVQGTSRSQLFKAKEKMRRLLAPSKHPRRDALRRAFLGA